MNMDTTQISTEKFNVMEFLQKFLRRSSQLSTMYRDFQKFQTIEHQATELSKALTDNERGCSLEELDTVAEIVTGNPSHKSVIMKANDIAESARNNFVWNAKAVLTEYRGYLENAKTYFSALGNTSETIVDVPVKITNFVKHYPYLDFVVSESGNICCGTEVRDGRRSVKETFDELDRRMNDMVGIITDRVELINSVIDVDTDDPQKYVTNATKVLNTVNDTQMACLCLMKYRELVKTFVEDQNSSIIG